MAYEGTALRKDSAFLRLSLYLTLTHKHATPHQWQTGTGIKNTLPADWHWQPVKALPGSQRTHFAISPECTILEQNASWEMTLTENLRQTLIYPLLLRGIIKTFISLCFILLPAIPVFALHVCFPVWSTAAVCLKIIPILILSSQITQLSHVRIDLWT